MKHGELTRDVSDIIFQLVRYPDTVQHPATAKKTANYQLPELDILFLNTKSLQWFNTVGWASGRAFCR